MCPRKCFIRSFSNRFLQRPIVSKAHHLTTVWRAKLPKWKRKNRRASREGRRSFKRRANCSESARCGSGRLRPFCEPIVKRQSQVADFERETRLAQAINGRRQPSEIGCRIRVSELRNPPQSVENDDSGIG